MIDIHCHILPSVDDGAAHKAESIQMIEQAIEEGITTIIATPHHLNGPYINEKQSIIKAVDQLNEEIKINGLNMNILPGQECRIYGDLVSDYHKGDILPLADSNKYVFVEFPSNHVPRYAKQLFYDMQLAGLTPIIVHPERNSQITEKPDLLYDFVTSGVLTQITTSSLTGHFGKKIKRFTEDLIEHNLTHFLASDAHSLVKRPFRMREALSELEKNFGTEVVYQFQENANLVVSGLHVGMDPPERIQKKKFLGIF
ncbi:tyrosine-protein phosphatase [Alkalihalobacterium alkalinitrilicum]|uniref:tyrosine-protein phosphatase n=1 Tax=Alkalihalobacterium alkalinitrilicum TaxID=427920 RepID=UPI00099577E6|nr:CpsB/CapC family capsule biosynthesis tyrosine phosphatase [Alkalihalobacterium alkalinitrilicum]